VAEGGDPEEVMASMPRVWIALIAILLLCLSLGAHLASAGSPPQSHPLPALTLLRVTGALVEPPVAKKIPHAFEEFGHRRVDNYDWLRNESDPDVLAYLKAENAYAAARLGPIKPLIEELERELHARADGSRESPPFFDNGYLYQRRLAVGARFPVIVRHRPQPGAPEQVVLDIESLAAGHKQYSLDNYVVSPDNNLVAFAVDFTGGRSHRIFVRDIDSGQVVDTGIKDAASDLVFSADSKSLLYNRVEPSTVRSYQVWRHALEGDGPRDKLLYEEKDPTFELNLSKSKSGRFILLKLDQQRTTEIRYLPADRPNDSFKIMEPRRHGLIYEADHIGDRFYIRTNLHAPDFRLASAPENAPQAANWATVVAETPQHFISEFELFDTFIAVVEEHEAIQSIRVFRRADMSEMAVPRPVEIGVMDMDFAQGASNRDSSATILQMRFSAPNLPPTAYDFDTRTGELSLRKRSWAWGWCDPQAYEVKRIFASASDGESIPVTLIYRKEFLRLGGNPTLVTGYGAYGLSTLPSFLDSWISLVDRGFVYAIAHVRGGREKGRRWHDAGSMLNKHNSFSDFIAATEALIARGVADPKRVFAYGASAGGLLVGAVANMRPDLYAGIVAEVPFADVVTTMADPTLPLTTLEYEEWGNPAIKEQYEAMLSYSPYDNVIAQRYPAMFITGALHDSQVAYHEPAKWVAKLRATKTDDHELLLLTDLETGHTGTAGRFGSMQERAGIMAWIIGQSELR
jgi:oligopeptidase B